ncbi:PREDICTED: LOC18786261, partial [Prunus dulcis]
SKLPIPIPAASRRSKEAMVNQPVGNDTDNTERSKEALVENQQHDNFTDDTERSEESMGNQQNNIVGNNTEMSMESDDQRKWPDIEDSCKIQSISSGEGSPEVYFYPRNGSPSKTKMSGPKQFLQKAWKWFPGKGRK